MAQRSYYSQTRYAAKIRKEHDIHHKRWHEQVTERREVVLHRLDMGGGSPHSCSSAEMSVAGGGGSIKSNASRSLMPMAFMVSTVMPRLMRWISGTDSGSISDLNATCV